MFIAISFSCVDKCYIIVSLEESKYGGCAG